MKKVFALVVALAAITMSAQAQIDFGVKGGLNLSKMSASKDALNSSNQLGFFVGPTAKFTLPVVGLGIDVSALFDQRSSEVELNGMKETIKQTSLQIPANVRFAFGFGDKASIFIFGGPQIGFNLSGKAKDVFNDAAEWTFKSSNLSGNIGAGVMLMKHIQASLNYNFQLGKTGEFEVENYEAEELGKNGSKSNGRINAWQLSIAYFF